jgi:integrase
VFNREDGSPLSPEVISRRFKAASATAGLPAIRFHDLRHTSASLALAAGVAIKVVSDRLGHSTSGITADLYTHVSPAVGRDAADAIAATFAALRRRDVDQMLTQDALNARPEESSTR